MVEKERDLGTMRIKTHSVLELLTVRPERLTHQQDTPSTKGSRGDLISRSPERLLGGFSMVLI